MYCGLCISNLDQVLNKTNDSSLTIPSEEDVKELVYFSGRDYDTMKNFLHRYCGNSLVIAIRSLVLAEKRVIEEDLLIDSALFDDGRLSSNLNCKICMDPLTIEETFVSNCGHYYHTLCMKMHIMSCMDDGEFSVFPCPQKQVYPKCGKDITVNELRAILGEQDLERCQYRAAQKLFSSDSSFFCCPSPDCSNVVWLDIGGQGAVCEEKGGCEMSCALCSRSTCVLCSAQPFHHGEMCSSRSANQGDEEAATMAFLQSSAAQSRACPRCSTWLHKAEGCDKLKCRCGYRFCWRCGAENAQCACTPAFHGFWDNVSNRGDFSALRGPSPVPKSSSDQGRSGGGMWS